MTKGFRVLLAVAVLAPLGACTHWSGDLERIVDQSGRDFKREPDRKYPVADLEEVAAHPSSFMLVDINFYAILNRRHENVFVTLYSFFRQEDYTSFSVWPLAARLWDGEDRVKSLPTLYMRKDNPDLERVLHLDRYALLSIRGRVMGDFEGLPYIDVKYVDVIDPAMYDDESLAQMGRGLESKEAAKAIPALEAALKGSLGTGARVIAHVKLAGYYETRGGEANLPQAVDHYSAALELDRGHAGAAEGKERCVKKWMEIMNAKLLQPQ